MTLDKVTHQFIYGKWSALEPLMDGGVPSNPPAGGSGDWNATLTP